MDTVEVAWTEGARQIDQCEYLFAVSLREIEELTFELIVEEAKPQAQISAVTNETPVEQLLLNARPIETDVTCRTFRLVFERRHMVSYSVLNESYGIYPKPPEDFTGKLFRVFSWSHLLEFTRKTTYASDDYPGGALQHYGVVCLNHVINAICTAPPRIFVRVPAAVQTEPTLQ